MDSNHHDKFRRLAAYTLAEPGIESGGVGESQTPILSFAGIGSIQIELPHQKQVGIKCSVYRKPYRTLKESNLRLLQNGASGGNRIPNLLLKRETLCQLSYACIKWWTGRESNS